MKAQLKKAREAIQAQQYTEALRQAQSALGSGQANGKSTPDEQQVAMAWILSALALHRLGRWYIYRHLNMSVP
jgi:hypothetical protein